MERYNTIEITLKNGRFATWSKKSGEWDQYSYDGSAFIVKKDGNLVGLYNLKSIDCIVVKQGGAG